MPTNWKMHKNGDQETPLIPKEPAASSAAAELALGRPKHLVTIFCYDRPEIMETQNALIVRHVYSEVQLTPYITRSTQVEIIETSAR